MKKLSEELREQIRDFIRNPPRSNMTSVAYICRKFGTSWATVKDIKAAMEFGEQTKHERDNSFT